MSKQHLYTNKILMQLKENVIASYNDLYNNDSHIFIISYRQNMQLVSIYLKLNSVFNFTIVIDSFAIDTIENKFRFTIFYKLQSYINNTQVTLITKTTETLPLYSLESIFPAFNWSERETWDMLGIFFIQHNDLRRILTDYGFIGHPLRKDFPVSGFKEIQYSDETKQIVQSSVELPQNFRLLNINHNWNIINA